jgi:hypothetical protein
LTPRSRSPRRTRTTERSSVELSRASFGAPGSNQFGKTIPGAWEQFRLFGAEHGFAPAMLDGVGLIVDNEAGLVFVL